MSLSQAGIYGGACPGLGIKAWAHIQVNGAGVPSIIKASNVSAVSRLSVGQFNVTHGPMSGKQLAISQADSVMVESMRCEPLTTTSSYIAAVDSAGTTIDFTGQFHIAIYE